MIEDLTSCILDFQANIVRVTNRKKTTLVDPDIEEAHAAALTAIWECSKLEEEIDENGHPLKWRKLGFDTEDIVQEFSEVGVLGLECLVSDSQNDSGHSNNPSSMSQKKFVESDPDFSKVSTVLIL
jgi:engulfment/cell motility protein 1